MTNVSLHLRSLPENVAVAREALAGLAESVALSREQYDDVRTAVTEACNNVVQHAYGEGHGPLEVEMRVLADAVEVIVRDEGIGLSHVAAHGGGELEIGLPVILALADRLELGHPPAGGTEVHMRFRAPGVAALPQATAPRDIDLPGFAPEVRLAFSEPRLAGPILARVAAALAARAHFSTDRVADVQLLADSIAAGALRTLDGSVLEVGLAASGRRLDMQVSPLLRGGSKRIDLLDELADRHAVTPIGPAEALVLCVEDRA